MRELRTSGSVGGRGSDSPVYPTIAFSDHTLTDRLPTPAESGGDGHGRPFEVALPAQRTPFHGTAARPSGLRTS